MKQTAPSKFGFALTALFFLSACDPAKDEPADDTSNTDPNYACADAAECLSFQSGSPSLCEPEMTDGDSTGEDSSTT